MYNGVDYSMKEESINIQRVKNIRLSDETSVKLLIYNFDNSFSCAFLLLVLLFSSV